MVTDTKVAVAAIGVAKPSSCTSNGFFEQGLHANRVFDKLTDVGRLQYLAAGGARGAEQREGSMISILVR